MKDQTKTVGEDKEMMAPHKTYDIMGIKVDVCFLDGKDTFETRLQQLEEMMKLSE